MADWSNPDRDNSGRLAEDFSGVRHAYPMVSEAVREFTLAENESAIHI